MLKITAPTARKTVDVAVEAGILREISGKARNRVFASRKYLHVVTGDES